MKRRALQILELLLFGAIVNVAVAWGCVLAQSNVTYNTTYFHNPSAEHPLVIAMTELYGYRIVTGVDRSGTLLQRYPEIVKNYEHQSWWTGDALKSWNNNFAMACGWPSLSLTSWRTMYGEDEKSFPGVIHRGILCDLRNSSKSFDEIPSILALQLIWPGFAVNTIFYAAVLWIAFALPSALRRKRRIMRGLCPACAYPVGGSPVCTECGQALKRFGTTDEHE